MTSLNRFPRLLGIALLASAAALSGCSNDTGSSKLPGGDDHDHGGEVTAAKVATPLRVTQIGAHHDVAQIVGFATGNKVMYVITPEKTLYEQKDWSNGEDATRSQHLFDAHGEHFLILDTAGKLHILDTADWSYHAGVQVVTAASVTQGAKITVSLAENLAFITDPAGKAIQVVDIETGTLQAPIALDFTPSAAGLAWTGIAAGHDHEEEGHVHAAAEDDHDHEATHPGRLILANSGDHAHAYVYDLEEGKLLEEDFHLENAPNAFYTSPGGRYAVIVQQAGNLVQFLDSGISAHDDHVHADAPAMLTLTLTGTKPAHYRSVDGLATMFFDEGSLRFVLFSDASLAANALLASESGVAAHHGIAEPRGEVVLVSKADRSGVVPYALHDDHFHAEGEVDVACEGLHGGGSNAGWSAFGCNDGVLLVGTASEDDHAGHDH